MPEGMLCRDQHPISQGGEGKEGVPCTQASPMGVSALPPAPAAAGCAGGAAACSVTQTCRMSVGSRPSSQMLCKGSSSA